MTPTNSTTAKLRQALAPHLNAAAPEYSHPHECGPACSDPCQHAGKVYRYSPVPIPPDHVLLEWYTLPDGGRIVKDMHVDALAEHLSEHGASPLTHASATAALAKKHAIIGKDTGIAPYLDKWQAEGLLP